MATPLPAAKKSRQTPAVLRAAGLMGGYRFKGVSRIEMIDAGGLGGGPDDRAAVPLAPEQFPVGGKRSLDDGGARGLHGIGLAVNITAASGGASGRATT